MLASRKTPIDFRMASLGTLTLRTMREEISELSLEEHVLALITFGSTLDNSNAFHIPLESLDARCHASAWVSDQPSTLSHPSAAVTLTKTDHFIFGSVRLSSEHIERSTKQAYRAIQSAINQFPSFQLIRLWNFFPRINDEDDGMERYRLFSRARHDVLASSGYRMASDLPAASAVGSQKGPLIIHFLAGNGAISSIENPRQVSAYHYPRAYGPRSPSFSRAVIHKTQQGHQLFLSGTASIIGHETIAPSDPALQTQVTIENLSALLEAAQFPKMRTLGNEASWVVYVRDPQHLDLVRSLITQHIHPSANIVYLQGDICRKDLMVEIEGTIFRKL